MHAYAFQGPNGHPLVLREYHGRPRVEVQDCGERCGRSEHCREAYADALALTDDAATCNDLDDAAWALTADHGIDFT